ncbi:hypothetical protein B0H19DRAFT_1172535 [Mycena capillaripes]|nr:hypothetical protein B0H19DRAFT_1172535 [Mycena capillaripes]
MPTPLPGPALCPACPTLRRPSSHLTPPPLTAQVCSTSQRSPSLCSRSRLPPQPTHICPAFTPSCPMLLGSLLPAVSVMTKSATSLFVSCDYDTNPFAGGSAHPTVRRPPARLHHPSYNTATVIGALVVLSMSPRPCHRALAAHTGVRRRKRKTSTNRLFWHPYNGWSTNVESTPGFLPERCVDSICPRRRPPSALTNLVVTPMIHPWCPRRSNPSHALHAAWAPNRRQADSHPLLIHLTLCTPLRSSLYGSPPSSPRSCNPTITRTDGVVEVIHLVTVRTLSHF